MREKKLDKTSSELLTFYTCTLATIRFLEGISWGYSPLLIHDTLDKETSYAIRVIYNLLLRVKQLYRENK